MFLEALKNLAGEVDGALDELLRPEAGDRLGEAMHYAVLGGGKRLRPYFLIEGTRLLSGDLIAALRTACAHECLHAYSLVHDDLPAMDDDDLRRGRPTVHRAYDEATAILVGDALQTLAFEILADPATHEDPAIRAELALELARAAGARGMAGGQMRDLAAANGPLDADGVRAMQAMKTGALFRYSSLAAAIIAGAGDDDRARLTRFGETIGAAFQVADDLLDERASAEEIGKATGKDRDAGKSTLPALMGVEAADALLDALVAEAKETLKPYGDKAAPLLAAADFVASRTY